MMDSSARQDGIGGSRLFYQLQFLFQRRLIMKWTGMYLIGYIVFICGVLTALWEKGVLFTSIGMAWAVIGMIMLIGFGIMIGSLPQQYQVKIGIDRK
jgi:hypothetical protein